MQVKGETATFGEREFSDYGLSVKNGKPLAVIKAINADVETALNAFCKGIFSDVIHLKAVISRTAAVENLYDALVKENDESPPNVATTSSRDQITRRRRCTITSYPREHIHSTR